jgi:hypothetical protein
VGEGQVTLYKTTKPSSWSAFDHLHHRLVSMKSSTTVHHQQLSQLAGVVELTISGPAGHWLVVPDFGEACTMIQMLSTASQPVIPTCTANGSSES